MIDAGIGDDEIRRAEIAREVLRDRADRRFVGDVGAVRDRFAGKRARIDRPARNESQDVVVVRVVPRQRLSDPRGGAGDDDA
jgi:hypothetical protein